MADLKATLCYRSPGAGPIRVVAPGKGSATVLLWHSQAAKIYYAVAYFEGSAPGETRITLAQPTDWCLLAELPGGSTINVSGMNVIIPAGTPVDGGGVTADGEDPPPPGPIHGGNEI